MSSSSDEENVIDIGILEEVIDDTFHNILEETLVSKHANILTLNGAQPYYFEPVRPAKTYIFIRMTSLKKMYLS